MSLSLQYTYRCINYPSNVMKTIKAIVQVSPRNNSSHNSKHRKITGQIHGISTESTRLRHHPVIHKPVRIIEICPWKPVKVNLRSRECHWREKNEKYRKARSFSYPRSPGSIYDAQSITYDAQSIKYDAQASRRCPSTKNVLQKEYTAQATDQWLAVTPNTVELDPKVGLATKKKKENKYVSK